MQRMLSESYSLRLLQEAREAKTQILMSETCTRCFISHQYIWFWTLSSNFSLCLHLILTSVSVIWPQVSLGNTHFKFIFYDYLFGSQRDILWFWNHLPCYCAACGYPPPPQTNCSEYTVLFFLVLFFSFPPPSFSLDFMDRKFDQVLSLQQLDKSKAISQILEEVTI